MRTLFSLTVLLFCTSANAAPVPKELKKQGSIAGVWKLESVTFCGLAMEVGADDVTDWRFDENFAFTRRGRQEDPQMPTQLKIDTTTKEIDWPMGESTLLGRYEVSGDRLTICLGTADHPPRPTGVEPNENNIVFVIRRAEK